MTDSPDEQDYKTYAAEVVDRTKFQIALIERGIQTLMFMNGGALVALFSLVGGKPGLVIRAAMLWVAFAIFASGIVFGAIANFAAFFSQAWFAEVAQRQAWDAQRKMNGEAATENLQPAHRAGMVWQMVGVGSAGLGVAAFAIGCAFAFAGVLPK